MHQTLLQFDSYREYLRGQFSGTGETRGRRSQLAEYLKCQTSFVSLVLTDRAHLSLELALRTSDFLNHADDERDFFILLVEYERSGTQELRNFFKHKIEKIRQNHMQIKKRIAVDHEIDKEQQAVYYSSWHYAAVHILTAFEEYQNAAAIAKRLNLGPRKVKEILIFLAKSGLIRFNGERCSLGPARIHLEARSMILPRHHVNWRLKAMSAVDDVQDEELHYTAILGISKKDMMVFKVKMLELIESFEPIIKKSAIEESVVLLLDLFKLK